MVVKRITLSSLEAAVVAVSHQYMLARQEPVEEEEAILQALVQVFQQGR
jgi:hypothetical protein